MDVQPDETNIAPLPGDGITDAELDTLESGHRYVPVAPQPFICLATFFPPTYTTCMNYFVYGVVVNHYRELDDGTIDQTILGRMWTNENRRAFANFYKNSIVSTDGGKFLRSAAHELGHAFNLHHEDGDGYSSIMDQTGVVDDHYVYQFAALSHDHLRNHPVNCIQPGTGAFAFIDMNESHALNLRRTHGPFGAMAVEKICELSGLSRETARVAPAAGSKLASVPE